jgi:type VII secretion integral membrane protein EccD
MPDSLCRVSVQHGPHTVDLALPSETPVGMLMPSIVHLVHQGPVAVNEGRQWHLSRIGDERLDAVTTLRDNTIRDGELLLLTNTGIPSPVWIEGDTWHTVSAAADTGRMPTRAMAAAASLCAAVLGAAALVWSGAITHATGHVVTGAALAGAAAIGAVALRRAHVDPVVCSVLSVIAVVFASAAGFLAVPGGSSTANSLLAAAVGCTMATLLLRATRCGAMCLTALLAFGAMTCAAAACGVAWTLPPTTTGALLSVLSLGALGVAPKLSIAAAGLALATPSSKERAVAAHRFLTGLIAGSASAATLGAALVAWSSTHDGHVWRKEAIFAAMVGLVMVLRARTHIDRARRVALVVAGIAAIAAGAALVVISAPEQANWICLLVTAGGVSMLGGLFGATVNPLVRRAVDVMEYVALVAVAPLACWVADLYGVIRDLSLP